MGGTTTITTTTTIFSLPPGVRNFGFSICALCLLRDVEKETHKHKVLWELVKTRGRKNLCTLNRVGVSVKNVIVNFLLKIDQISIFLKNRGVGVMIWGCNNDNNNNNYHCRAAARG